MWHYMREYLSNRLSDFLESFSHSEVANQTKRKNIFIYLYIYIYVYQYKSGV